MPRAAHRQDGAIIHLLKDITNDAVIRTRSIKKKKKNQMYTPPPSLRWMFVITDQGRIFGEKHEEKLEPLSEGGDVYHKTIIHHFLYI